MKTHLMAIAVATIMLLQPELVSADVFNLQLTLDPVDPQNQINQLTLEALGEQDTTDLSGTVDIQINLNPQTGEITELTFTGGSFFGTNIGFDFGFFGSISGTNLGGTIETPSPPGSVIGVDFPASEHDITLNSGEITGTGIVGSAIGSGFSFNDLPLTSPGVGMGTITANQNGDGYDITVLVPVSISEVIATIDVVGDVVLDVNGNVQASGFVQTSSIPEPTCGLVIFGSIALLCARRKRA